MLSVTIMMIIIIINIKAIIIVETSTYIDYFAIYIICGKEKNFILRSPSFLDI